MALLRFLLIIYLSKEAFSYSFTRLLRVSIANYTDASLERYTNMQTHFECAKQCRGPCLAYYYSFPNQVCQTYSREFCQDSEAEFANSSVHYFTRNNYQTCSDVHASCPSGWYPITPSTGQTLKVYCDLSSPQGPWIVIHNRQDIKGNFYRGWNDYKNGFGYLGGNFWIGNEIIHQLTDLGYTILRIELEAWDDTTRYIEYSSFSLADETDKYRIQATYTSGDVYNALSYHNGRQFTTFDADNDACGYCNCAVSTKGAWWYSACVDSNLNGLYLEDKGSDIYNSMLWYRVFPNRNHVPMKKARMMIKQP